MRTPWTIQYDNDTAWWMAILINFFFVKKKKQTQKNNKNRTTKANKTHKPHLIKDSFGIMPKKTLFIYSLDNTI